MSHGAPGGLSLRLRHPHGDTVAAPDTPLYTVPARSRPGLARPATVRRCKLGTGPGHRGMGKGANAVNCSLVAWSSGRTPRSPGCV